MKPIDTELLETIAQNTEMGMHNMDVLLDCTHIKNEEFRKVLKEQYDDYKKINAQAEDYIKLAGGEVKSSSTMAKAMSKMGIKMNTMMDRSVSHIADMLIQGSTMGITDITKELNEKGGNAKKEVAELADELLHIHQKNIDTMRSYL